MVNTPSAFSNHVYLLRWKIIKAGGDAIRVLCHSVGMTSNITFGAIYAFMEIPAQPAQPCQPGSLSTNLSAEPRCLLRGRGKP